METDVLGEWPLLSGREVEVEVTHKEKCSPPGGYTDERQTGDGSLWNPGTRVPRKSIT